MNPTEEDFSLLHSRARKIEANLKNKEDALYWCDMTIQAVNLIKTKIDERYENVKNTSVTSGSVGDKK